MLDTSGTPLKAALGQGLTLIKPSLNEFEALLGHECPDPKDQEAAAMELVRSGASKMVVVSLGPDGALMATEEGTRRLGSPKVEVRSAVGAGDSFVAGMTLSLARGMTAEDALAFGVATGASAVGHYGTARPNAVEVAALFAEIRGRAP